MGRARALAGALLVFAFGMATASAQPGEGQRASAPSESQIAEARARFVAGGTAIEEGRWAEAVDNFERAYELTGAPTALYNLGVSLRGLGHYLRARDEFDKLLRRHGRELDGDLASNAVRFRDEVASRLAAIELIGLDPAVRYELRLDVHRVRDGGERPLTVETDPGAHVLVTERDGHVPFEWRGELRPGERRRVEVRLALVPRRPGEEEGGLLGEPAFWVVVGAVVAAAGGVTAFFVLRDDGELSPESDKVVDLR